MPVSRVSHSGTESGEILARHPQVTQGGPEGQNLGTLVVLLPDDLSASPFNHKVYISSVFGQLKMSIYDFGTFIWPGILPDIFDLKP